jgi:hypothetical protein
MRSEACGRDSILSLRRKAHRGRMIGRLKINRAVADMTSSPASSSRASYYRCPQMPTQLCKPQRRVDSRRGGFRAFLLRSRGMSSGPPNGRPDPLAARLRSRGFIDQSFYFYNCRKVVFRLPPPELARSRPAERRSRFPSRPRRSAISSPFRPKQRAKPYPR